MYFKKLLNDLVSNIENSSFVYLCDSKCITYMDEISIDYRYLFYDLRRWQLVRRNTDLFKESYCIQFRLIPLV